MRAIQINQYGGAEQLKSVEVPKPNASKGKLVVRVMAASFNPIDVKLTSGNMRQIMPLQFPFVPGVDFSGTVDSVGEGVTGFRTGEEVWGAPAMGGAYADYIEIDADKVGSKPRTLGDIEAASLALVGQTALQLIEQAEIQKGQTVLIQGAGGSVGSVAVQAALERGAKVIGTAAKTSANRLKEYGAEQVVDYQTQAFEKIVKDVDVVLDTVGGEVQQRSFAALKKGGVLVAISQPPSQDEAANYGVRASMLRTQPSTTSLQKLAQLIDSGAIKPFVGKVYPLSEAAKAWQDFGDHVEGKIVFKVAAEAGQSAGAR